VPTPSAESFAALARSSPWLWSTLRFTVRWPGDRFRPEELRAWLRLPDDLRVETVGGEFRQIVHQHRATAAVLGMPPDGETTRTYPWPAEAERPLFRPDGFVEARPAHVCHDAPMYQNYHWVAMLDPVELADGIEPDTGATVPSLVIDGVTEVEHAGRPAWEALVATTPAYEPRCGCCPLLRSLEVDVREYGPRSEHVLDVYPDAYRVRLDVGTGVCVFTAAVGGPEPGELHTVGIEAVDEPMDNDLFAGPRSARRGRSRR
jgi:hypothetical protein